MHEQNTPLIRLAKRDDMPRWQVWCIRGGSFVAAILLGALIFLIMGHSPVSAYGTILSGSLGKKTAVWQTVKIAIPLLGTALAIAPCFKMRFWNIGAEGQITAGAVAASYFALFWYDKLPSPVLLAVMAASGALFGGLWALIPAFFKARWGTNETLFTLMMNYIATQLVAFFTIVWEVPKGSGKIGIINQNTNSGWLPQIFGSKYLLSILVAVVITIFMYIYLQYSKHGYEITVVGESENTAKYVGIKVEKVIIRTMVLSGAICGLVGLLLVGGINHTVTTTIAGGQGFTAVLVSWMSKFNPLVMVFSSFLIIFMDRGASEISTNFGLNHSYADILTGIILFFIIGCEFFITYRLQFRKKAEKEEQ
mgnify:CR=1 FL=1